MRKPNYPNRKSPPSYTRLLFILAVFVVITTGFHLFIYFQTRVLQALFPPALILVAVLIGPLVYRWLSLEKNIQAGISLVIAVAVAYSGNELAWKGLTAFNVIGGCLLIALSGIMILPHRWRSWTPVIFGFLIFIYFVNRFEPVPRYEQSLIAGLLPFAVSIDLILLIGLFILLIMQNPARSIRVRLIATFIILVVIPVVATTTIASIINAQNFQDRAATQLESVATLREAEINAWLDRLVAELKVVKPSDLELSGLLGKDPQSTSLLTPGLVQDFHDQFERVIQETGLFKEVFLVDWNGRIFLTTNPNNLDQVVAQQTYFQQGIKAEYIAPPSISADGLIQMTVALPLSINDRTILLAGLVNMSQLNDLLTTRAGLGTSSETYLVARSHRLITPSAFPDYQAGISYLFSKGIYQALEDNVNGKGIYSDYRGQTVIGVYHWLPRLNAALLVEQSQSVVNLSIVRGIIINLILMALASILVLVIGSVVTNHIVAPLTRLSRTAERIASGDRELLVEAERLDETGAIARSFNSLTSQLRGLAANLEQQIQDRTSDLEKRSAQLQIATEVAREVVGLRDLNELLNHAVDLIHDQFDYYFVGIYLVDEPGDNAVLAAATGEAGQFLLARNHSVKIGESGFVGDVTLSGRVRIDSDIKQNPYYTPNPLLPDTCSEAALPLKAGSNVIGVVDIHSMQVGAFTDDALYILGIITDQLSIAIQNSLLLLKMTQTIKELESVYGTSTQKSWQVIEQRRLAQKGYHYQNLVVGSPEEEHPSIQEAIHSGKVILTQADSADENKDSLLTVPIKVRGQTIGAFELHFENPTIPSSIVSTYEEIADRLGLILENARLLQEAQRLAQREQQINLISSRVRSSINLEAVLQNTVQELGRAFGATRTFIQVGLDNRGESQPVRESQSDPG